MGNLIQGRSTTDISPLTGRGRVEEINSINRAVATAIQTDATQLLPYGAQIYSGTAVGNTVTSNLTDWTDFLFHILGVDADDDVTIQASIDGTNLVEMGVVEITTNTFVAAGTPIETAGIYRFASAAGVPMEGLVVSKLKATRNTATGSNAVTVYATARPVN